MCEVIKREGTKFARSEKVLSFLGTKRCKLIYRSRREKNITAHVKRASDRAKGSSFTLLDYREGGTYPTVYEYPEDPKFKSFAPLFSPDGEKILYNQTFQQTDILILPVGSTEPVKVAVGANPHWCKDDQSGRLYVVFRDFNGGFDHIPQKGKTYRIEIDENNEPVGEPEMIATFGFGGGMSHNARYLCSALMLPVAMDRQTGAISAPLGTVMRKPDRTNQCCCASIAPDNTGRMMVLRWPHDRFSVMGWDGSAKKHYIIPEGSKEWQTPEWSTHPKFATGSVMNDEYLYNVVMVDLLENKYLQVTTEGGYVHAHLWVG